MLGGISIWQLLIILAIVIMIFGTKRLRSLGGDLGGAVKGFRKAMNEDAAKEEDKDATPKNLAHDEKDAQPDAEFSKSKDQDKA